LRNWWDRPLRAVTLEFPAADIKRLDVRELIKKLADYGVNTINVFVVSYWPGGAAYYKSSLAPAHPDLGDKDLLATALDEAHKHDMKVIAYVNVLWGDKNMFEKHPEWAQRRADGKITTWEPSLTTVAMCPNTKYQEYILQVVKEIAGNYDVDGFYFDEPCFQSWCNCESCRQTFMKETSKELPAEAKWHDSTWQQFVRWRYNKITQFKRALYDASKKDGRAIFFQHPFPLAFWPKEEVMTLLNLPEDFITRFVKQTARWYVPLMYGADLEATAEIEDLLHFELYRKSVDRPLWWYGVCLRLGRYVGQGKPIMVLNMQGYSPFDLYSLPEPELRLAVGEITANAANPLFALYYPDIADTRGWNILGRVFHELKSSEQYLVDLESVKFAAVLHSSRTTDLFDSDTDSTRHVECLMGVCKALLRDHVLFDVITEMDLEKNLRNYNVLVLPDVASMTKKECELVAQFVKDGNGVVASYRTSLFDENGKQLQNLGLEFLGASYLGSEKYVKSHDSYMCVKEAHPVTELLPRDMYLPSMGSQLAVQAKGKAIPLATLIEEPEAHYAPLKNDTGIPTILANEYGKGRSVYFPGPIGEKYLSFGVYDHWKLIANAVRWAAHQEQPVRVQNCPSTVELTAYTQPKKDRVIVHVVNSVRSETDEPICDAGSERDLKLYVRTGDRKKRYRVYAVPGRKPVPYERMGNSISLRIPEFRYHRMIVIEGQSGRRKK